MARSQLVLASSPATAPHRKVKRRRDRAHFLPIAPTERCSLARPSGAVQITTRRSAAGDLPRSVRTAPMMRDCTCPGATVSWSDSLAAGLLAQQNTAERGAELLDSSDSRRCEPASGRWAGQGLRRSDALSVAAPIAWRDQCAGCPVGHGAARSSSGALPLAYSCRSASRDSDARGRPRRVLGGINRSTQRWLVDMLADTRPAPRRVSSNRVSCEGGC